VIERTNILGTAVSAVNMESAVSAIGQWIQSDERQYVCVTGVHGIMESFREPELQKIHNRAGLVTPDGMPLVWISKFMGHQHVERVYGPDLMLELCAASTVYGWSHFFYGGAPDVAERLARNLQDQFKGLKVAGVLTPPYTALTIEEEAAVVSQINSAAPDIVWVGLSTPKQERWMHLFRTRLNAAALIGVGAAFDFHAGLKRQAPTWIQRSGFEWLFRLTQEPRRLWRRYLRNNPEFVFLVALQILGLKSYHSNS
jgi:N-acetylglucosaminyldiphosphoundecaprenol N-acetyl-beta-D-mannosaminyltransferase